MEELNVPIPGSSLTDSPGNMPYERPPQFTDPEDALLMHLDNLNQPEVTEALIDAIDTGLDIQTITEGILRNGVAAGRHSIDISLIIAPVIHEFIKGTADAAGVAYEEGFDNPEEKREMKKNVKRMMTQRVRDKLEEVPEEMAQEMPKAEPKGIARRPTRVEEL